MGKDDFKKLQVSNLESQMLIKGQFILPNDMMIELKKTQIL